MSIQKKKTFRMLPGTSTIFGGQTKPVNGTTQAGPKHVLVPNRGIYTTDGSPLLGDNAINSMKSDSIGKSYGNYAIAADDICLDIDNTITTLIARTSAPHLYLGMSGHSVVSVFTDPEHASPNPALLALDLAELKSVRDRVANGNFTIPFTFKVLNHHGGINKLTLTGVVTECPTCQEYIPEGPDKELHRFTSRHARAETRLDIETDGYVLPSAWGETLLSSDEIPEIDSIRIAFAAGLGESAFKLVGDNYYVKQALVDLVSAYTSIYMHHMTVDEYCELLKSTAGIPK